MTERGFIEHSDQFVLPAITSSTLSVFFYKTHPTCLQLYYFVMLIVWICQNVWWVIYLVANLCWYINQAYIDVDNNECLKVFISVSKSETYEVI